MISDVKENEFESTAFLQTTFDTLFCFHAQSFSATDSGKRHRHRRLCFLGLCCPVYSSCHFTESCIDKTPLCFSIGYRSWDNCIAKFRVFWRQLITQSLGTVADFSQRIPIMQRCRQIHCDHLSRNSANHFYSGYCCDVFHCSNGHTEIHCASIGTF